MVTSADQLQQDLERLLAAGWVMRSFWVVLMLCGCGGPPNPCANVPCSEGRVCVVRDLDKVACEVPDAGAP